VKKDSRWNIHEAGLMYSRDGAAIEISERPIWAVIAEQVGETMDTLTFHLFCCRTPGWTYKIRWGPKDPIYDIADKSLGHIMFRLGQWMASGFGTWNQQHRIASIPVSDEWVREHYPDAGWPWDGSSEDEMRVEFDKAPEGE
jgi:hypothetical protein